MILPCLACLALLTASAVPVVANDVETCSSEEVSNFRLDHSKSRVYSSDGEVESLDEDLTSLPAVAGVGRDIWLSVYIPANLEFTTEDGTDDAFALVDFVSDDVEVIGSSYVVYNADVFSCEDVSLDMSITGVGDYNEIDFKFAYDDSSVSLEISSFDYLVFSVTNNLGTANFGVTWDYLSRVSLDNFVNVSSSVETLGALENVNVLSLPSPVPDGVSIVREIVEILVSGITQLGAGIGGGVNAFAQALAFDVSGEALSVFMVFVVVFAGLALAVGLTRLIFGWLQNLGGH